MPYDYYQGDPRLIFELEGVTLSVKAGQPIMDQGFENVVLLDLFVDPEWWGNYVETDETKKIGSNFESVAREAATVDGIYKTQEAAKAALQHMIDENLASDVITAARNPSGSKVELAVLIKAPGSDLYTLLATKHGPNWLAQRDYPAYKRI